MRRNDRLALLENLELLRALKARYARLCDMFDADGASRLFANDGVFDLGEELGRHEGRAAIRLFFKQTWREFEWAMHLVMNEELRVVSPVEAEGVWRLWEPALVGGRALWLGGTYFDTYRLVDGTWEIALSRIELEAAVPYERGWREQRVVPILAGAEVREGLAPEKFSDD